MSQREPEMDLASKYWPCLETIFTEVRGEGTEGF